MAPKKNDKKKQADEEAARLKAEQEEKERDLENREKALERRLKEAQSKEKEMKQKEEDLKHRGLALDSREQDLDGREETIAQWMKERDEEWLAAQEGSQESHTKRERHAILIGANRYTDGRIQDLNHSLEMVRAIGLALEELNFKCEYLHDDLPGELLPTRQNIERLIGAARQQDVILVVIFVGHAVHGALTPPRSSSIMRFVLPCNTPLEFATDTVLSVDELYSMMTTNTVDINDNPFKRKGLLVVDGSYPGPTHGAASTGFAYLRNTAGAELGVEYQRNTQCLLSLALLRGIEGRVNCKGQLPCNHLISYCQHKLVQRQGLVQYASAAGDDATDFPLANKLLKSKHELAALKEARKGQPCTFDLTYTVNQDLAVHSPLLLRIVSDRLIDFCGNGVEVGQMQLVGLTDVVLDGRIQYSTRAEMAPLWAKAVAQFTGTEDCQFQLILGESTRPGDEGKCAIIIRIASDLEEVINTMRTTYGKMIRDGAQFFGHPCLDFRQHIRVTLQGTTRQYETFNKVARRGQLDDSIFTFTGVHRAMYNIERFNLLADEKIQRLIAANMVLVVVCTGPGKAGGKRNQALGRVADLEVFSSRFRFFFYDILPQPSPPNVALLPGPDIGNHLCTNCVLLLDLKQGRNYVMLPAKSFFQGGFFPDCDIRMLCEDFLDRKLEALNHRVPGANAHPRYRLL
mmetsp:Transcript_63106/g.112590  ORF Transcript_63106/g.112590 Transcript_63106/m.112590 type:complete len:688 (-) Transcript_63106:29-2092(-)